MSKRGVLPKGAGGVRCLGCGAHAAADGKGTPIVLRHTEACPEETKRRAEDAATEALHEAHCPGCGCEPEVVNYWRRDGLRVGYVCSCGASVIDGLMVGSAR